MPKNYMFALSEAQNHCCYYCNHPMVTVNPYRDGTVPRDLLTKDHYLPRCYGGPTATDNLVAACGQCNWIRGTLDAETFTEIIQWWFTKDPTLHSRWHSISKEEFRSFAKDCHRIDKLQWQRRIKKCIGAMALNALVPLPFPPHLRA